MWIGEACTRAIAAKRGVEGWGGRFYEHGGLSIILAAHCCEMGKSVRDVLFCALCFGHSDCISEMITRKNDMKRSKVKYKNLTRSM